MFGARELIKIADFIHSTEYFIVQRHIGGGDAARHPRWSCINKAFLTFMACTWKNVNAVKLITPSIIIRLIYPTRVLSPRVIGEDSRLFFFNALAVNIDALSRKCER